MGSYGQQLNILKKIIHKQLIDGSLNDLNPIGIRIIIRNTVVSHMLELPFSL